MTRDGRLTGSDNMKKPDLHLVHSVWKVWRALSFLKYRTNPFPRIHSGSVYQSCRPQICCNFTFPEVQFLILCGSVVTNVAWNFPDVKSNISGFFATYTIKNVLRHVDVTRVSHTHIQLSPNNKTLVFYVTEFYHRPVESNVSFENWPPRCCNFLLAGSSGSDL